MKLKPCPNPECKNDEAPKLFAGQYLGNYAVVCCSNGMCEMSGPDGISKAEAIRLWNLLPRSEE